MRMKFLKFDSVLPGFKTRGRDRFCLVIIRTTKLREKAPAAQVVSASPAFVRVGQLKTTSRNIWKGAV